MMKKARKRPVGRPRKPNREYAGPVTLADLRDWSAKVDDLSRELHAQIGRLEQGRLEDVWMFGREVRKGIALLNAWTGKLVGAVTTALREERAGQGS